MDCPHCRDEVLVSLEHDQVEVDYCPVCRGVWLDAGEIELLFGEEDAAREFLSIGHGVEKPPDEAPRKCPVCGKRMTKEATEGDHPVVFDHCPNADGLWFDQGELAAVLRHADGLVGRSTEVAQFLRDVFPENDE